MRLPSPIPFLRGLPGVEALLRRFDLDRAVFLGVLVRTWSFIAGPLTLLLIATHFSPVVQGYYYTFGSLLGLVTFLEMGLSGVLIQCVSHEWAHLHLEGQVPRGDARALARTASLFQFGVKWYGFGGLVLTLLLGIVGLIFMSRSPDMGVAWRGPWIVVCIASGLNFAAIPFFSILAGCNQYANANQWRFEQAVLMSLATWTTILLGGGVWTLPACLGASAISAAHLVFVTYRVFYRSLWAVPPEAGVWKAEVLPFQWRVALSSLSGIFVYNLFTLVLFQYQGAVVAGQMGMTWTILNTISDVALTWVAVRMPLFGISISRADYAALDSAFLRASKVTMMVLLVGLASAVGGIGLLNAIGHHLAVRLLPPADAALFAIALVGAGCVSILTMYLRAHRRDPLLKLSLLTAVACGLSTVFLGSRYGATGMAAGWVVLQCLVLLPDTYVFLRCRKEWHAQPGKTEAQAAPPSPTPE